MGPVPDQWENPENDLFGNRRSPKPERKMGAAVSGSDDHQEHVQRHEALAHPEPASVSYDEGGRYPRAAMSTLTCLVAMLAAVKVGEVEKIRYMAIWFGRAAYGKRSCNADSEVACCV